MMENKHTIYFNMCHHYRKIFNAKATIDTSSPKTFQVKPNTQWKFSRNASPFRPKTPMQENVKTFQKEPYFMQDNGTITCKYYYQHHNKKDECKAADKSFTVPTKPFSPVILKSTAQSKLRNLRVYHPPRRKKIVKVSESSQSSPLNGDERKEEIVQRPVFDKPSIKNTKRQSFTVMDNHSYSEESSEDSAYNEGEGALSSDSRGSTPQNLTNKHQTVNSAIADNNQPSKATTNLANKRSDEMVYIQFLKDITNDILKKNIFTNKALKNVFQHHVQINKYDLDTEKMQKEITKLQERLGVPKDDKLDDEDYGLGKDVSISENFKSDDSSKEPPFRSNSLSVDRAAENVSPIVEGTAPDVSNSKEPDYSDDFSDYENHSLDSHSKRHDNDIVSYDTSEENDRLSSISNEVEEENNDESAAEENFSEEDTKSDSQSEISEIC